MCTCFRRVEIKYKPTGQVSSGFMLGPGCLGGERWAWMGLGH
jgi:hypothetical protein